MSPARSFVRYTCEVNFWEHSGAVSGTQVRLSFGNILGTEMEVSDMYTCQELCQVHM